MRPELHCVAERRERQHRDDVVLPGVNGFLIEDPKSGEQLAAALEPLLDHDRRRAMSAEVPRTVAAYQWPSVLQRYEQVLMQNWS